MDDVPAFYCGSCEDGYLVSYFSQMVLPLSLVWKTSIFLNNFLCELAFSLYKIYLSFAESCKFSSHFIVIAILFPIYTHSLWRRVPMNVQS